MMMMMTMVSYIDDVIIFVTKCVCMYNIFVLSLDLMLFTLPCVSKIKDNDDDGDDRKKK